MEVTGARFDAEDFDAEDLQMERGVDFKRVGKSVHVVACF